MAVPPTFSPRTLRRPEAKNPDALDRIALAKHRIQNILDRETVAHPKTLEQKIAEQGPKGQRVDPHLVGLAVADLLDLRRLRKHTHPATGTRPWYANPGTPNDSVVARLNDLAPLYASISAHGFGNLTGDALEVIVYKCLDRIYIENPQYPYQGHFHLDKPKNEHRRYLKTQPPKSIGSFTTQREADFLQFGHPVGPLCIECKNYREWLYPHHKNIKDLIITAYELHAIPVLITRRMHYTARSNFLEPAGISAHETYYQYFPSEQEHLAVKAKHRRSLGFTDITATEEPHQRTTKFFSVTLPSIIEFMAERWKVNRSVLMDYAVGDINLAQLYTAIGSPAGGKWQEFDNLPQQPLNHDGL